MNFVAVGYLFFGLDKRGKKKAQKLSLILIF